MCGSMTFTTKRDISKKGENVCSMTTEFPTVAKSDICVGNHNFPEKIM